MSVAIAGIGTAVPPSISQQRLTELGVRCCTTTDAEAAWLRKVYGRAGVESRGSVLEIDATGFAGFFEAPVSPTDRGPGTGRRMAAYAKLAPPLAARACETALADAVTDPRQITHLVTVSCTGFVAPGLDVLLIDRLNLPAGTQRLHVGFMGCHAALNALASAANIVRGDPAAVVLVCCVELCTLHFAYGFDPQRIVANALFADGAAAAIVTSVEAARSPAWRWLDSASLLLSGSGDAMAWTIGDHGYEMSLSPRVPELISGSLPAWLERWSPATVAHWAVHPGGPRILDAVEQSLGLTAEALQPSWQLLADHGNMSSTTILFLLDRLRAADARGSTTALAFGPGLMMEGALLER